MPVLKLEEESRLKKARLFKTDYSTENTFSRMVSEEDAARFNLSKKQLLELNRRFIEDLKDLKKDGVKINIQEIAYANIMFFKTGRDVLGAKVPFESRNTRNLVMHTFEENFVKTTNESIGIKATQTSRNGKTEYSYERLNVWPELKSPKPLRHEIAEK